MMPAALLIAAIAMAPGIEQRLVAGLVLTVEPVPEPVVVDGVGMIMQRVTGRGVPELVARIEALWRSQGSRLQSFQQSEWTVRSRLLGSSSELLQWRATTDGTELLWSQMDAARPVQVAPVSKVTLPAGCNWGRSISGLSGRQRYLQRSARCRHSVQSLLPLVKSSLTSQGWQVDSASGQGLAVRRSGTEGLLSLSGQQDGLTWLVWLQVEAVP